MTVHALFLDKTGALRSGWRAFVFICAFGISAVILGSLAYTGLSAAGVGLANGGPASLALNGIVSLVPALFFGWLCGRLFEGLPFRALGISLVEKWYRDLLLGCLIGSAMILIAVFGAWAGGGLSFVSGSDRIALVAGDLMLSFIIFAIAAAFEEVLFRGYLLQTFARSGLAWLAIALTSLFFGVVHLGNPAAGAASTVNTILAGVLFSIAYLKTRGLWFPFGIHLMWNWLQGSVFGIEVSGMRLVPATLLIEDDRGPVWLTGGGYGIEGGIACTIALSIAIIVIATFPAKSDPVE